MDRGHFSLSEEIRLSPVAETPRIPLLGHDLANLALCSKLAAVFEGGALLVYEQGRTALWHTKAMY